jgi:hypothetical protein
MNHNWKYFDINHFFSTGEIDYCEDSHHKICTRCYLINEFFYYYYPNGDNLSVYSILRNNSFEYLNIQDAEKYTCDQIIIKSIIE